MFLLERQRRRARRLVHRQRVRPRLAVQRTHRGRSDNTQVHYHHEHRIHYTSCLRQTAIDVKVVCANHLISTVGKCCCTSTRMFRRVLTGSSGGVSFSSEVMLASLAGKELSYENKQLNWLVRGASLVM